MTERPGIEEVYREHGPRVLAYLTGRFGDLELAEDALQTAVLRACETWPDRGYPENPAGWLASVGYRRAIDELRMRGRALPLEAEVLEAQPSPAETADADIPDERLSLIFLLCHPAIAADVRIPLVLSELAGFTAVELGRVYLLPPATIAQRLVRAKRKIRAARIPFGVPEPAELGGRVAAVRSVVYLIFTEGHSASRGKDLLRDKLTADALWLARVLVDLLEKHGMSSELDETRALLALMLLHDARRAARTDAAGALITLERQDRSLWDAGKISEGLSLLSKVLRSRGGAHRIGPYQVEAAIAAVHAEAEAFEVTDWAQMLELYDRLRELKPGIVTEVNRAVVLARVVGPQAALEALRPFQADPEGRAYPPLLLALGDLYERSGELDLAHRYLEKAADRATNEAERLHILGRLRRLGR